MHAQLLKMDDESNDDSCVELVDHESSDGSTDNELNEDDGVRQRFYHWKVLEVRFGNTSDSQHVMKRTVNPIKKSAK